jgi:arabinose-5-phosphate isomerase
MSLAQAQEVLRIEEQGIAAVRTGLGEEFTRAIDLITHCPGKLIITGIGKSGLVARKIAATMNSTGTSAYFLHPVEALHGDMAIVGEGDVILALSYGGETSELNYLLAAIRARSGAIIALTGNTSSTLAGAADVVLNVAVPQEACPLGLAPTASTTATLALGDALAVVLMNRSGFREADFRRNHPGGGLGERLKVRVAEVMFTGDLIPRVTSQARLSEAVDESNRKNLGAVVVTGAHDIVLGIITDGDIRRLVAGDEIVEGVGVTTVMTGNPVTISADKQAVDALSIMQEKEVTVLPVIEGEMRLIGILHLHDLLGKGEFRFLI